MRNTLCIVWLVVVVAWPTPAEAQQGRRRASTGAAPYIVPDEQAMEAKRQLLGRIVPIKSDAKRFVSSSRTRRSRSFAMCLSTPCTHRSKPPTSTWNVLPTVCAAAKVELPGELRLDGVDLLTFLKGDNGESPHDVLFWSNGPNRAVRHGDWKLIKSGKNTWLFDLANDLGETQNLAQENPDVVERLEAALRKWQDEMQPPAWPSKPNRRKVNIDGMTYELNI